MEKQEVIQIPFLHSEVRDTDTVNRLINATPFITELTKESIVEMLVSSGAILEGHFELLSKKHSLTFLTFGRVARRNGYRKKISHEIAARFKDYNIDAVASPITAGALLGSVVASDLRVDVFYIDVNEKTGLPLSRFVEGFVPTVSQETRRMLIVNDLAITGAGLRTMVNLVRQVNAEVVGIGLFAHLYENCAEKLALDVGGVDAKNVQFLVSLDKESFKYFDPPCPYPDCPTVPIAHSWELNR